MKMHNPPHPGEILKGLYMEPLELTVTKLAEWLHVDRKTISRLVNARAPVTVDVALRLAKAFSTTPDLWLGMQQDYDIWQARKRPLREISGIKPLRVKDARSEAWASLG